MFVEFVSRIHTPGRGEGRRQRRPQCEHARATMLQALVEDVRGVDEEIRPGLVGVCGEFVAELLELPARGLPREIGVGLREPEARQSVESCGAGECLGQEQHVGWRFLISVISHSQKFGGLVCGLSTRKMLTPKLIQCSTTRSTPA